MAVIGKLYGRVFTSLWNKEIDFDTDVIKVALTTVAHTPDQDAHDYFDDITGEVVGTGYTAGGATLGSKTVTYTTGTNKHVLDGADTQWAASTITARNAHVYDSSPATNATRPLIGYQQSDADISSSGGNFDIVWNAAGIVEITVA